MEFVKVASRYGYVPSPFVSAIPSAYHNRYRLNMDLNPDLEISISPYELYMNKHPMCRLPYWAYVKRSWLTPYLEKQDKEKNIPKRHEPWRFQWMYKKKLCVFSWPQYEEHLRFLLGVGVRRLVSLTPEYRPPIHKFTEFYWIEIPIDELAAPTMDQIKLFICFCDQARQFDEAVGIHCRVGRGCSGTLAACYLVRYCGLTSEQAIHQTRKVRPESINTLAQEASIHNFYKELCECPPEHDPCWNPQLQEPERNACHADY